MIVAVDGRRMTAGRGVERYTRRLCEHLALREDVDLRVIAGSRGARIAGVLTGRPTLLAAAGANVAWLPAPAPVAPGDPYVLTVHDISWIERPHDFGRYERLWHRIARFERLVRRAAAVVCDDASVATAVGERWGVAARVVEPGVDEPPAGVRPAVRERPYFLYVGALEPRKGLDVLAQAWRAAALDAELVVAGEGRCEVLGATMLGRVDDTRLHSLYAGARALVLPSRIEGFGLTPREAAAHGVPSIVSDLPSLRLPGTIRVPPGDTAALTDALLGLEQERDRLVSEIGPQRGWTQAADELAAVLGEATR